MDIGEQTVKWHLKNVFFKLNAASRKHAVDRARLLGPARRLSPPQSPPAPRGEDELLCSARIPSHRGRLGLATTITQSNRGLQ